MSLKCHFEVKDFYITHPWRKVNIMQINEFQNFVQAHRGIITGPRDFGAQSALHTVPSNYHSFSSLEY
jgi:hypothetical protein